MRYAPTKDLTSFPLASHERSNATCLHVHLLPLMHAFLVVDGAAVDPFTFALFWLFIRPGHACPSWDVGFVSDEGSS
jgi:hypothetical protein